VIYLLLLLLLGGIEWLGGVVVRASDSRSRGREFDSRPRRYQVTTLVKLFTPMCLCHQAVQFGTGEKAREVTAGRGRGVVYRP